MDDLPAKIAAEDTVAGAIELARLEVVALGGIKTTYHIAAPHASQVGPNVFIAVHGHEGDWLRDYYDPEIRKYDPFPDYVMRQGTAMTYAQALAKMKLSAEQVGFVETYHGANLNRTLAIPAYGPFDFDSFATITKSADFADDDAQLTEHLIMLVELTNRRVAQIMERDEAQSISLSERELEVLHWIGRSKSNGDIGTILDVSPATVDTYVRRIFAKLEVNDRIAAAIKGIRLGLIRY